jgi:hypothetical protein
MTKFHPFFEGLWRIRELDGDNVLSDIVVRNDLLDEGEKNILNTYFRASESPTQFYLRLAKDSIRESDTLSDIAGEPSGNGYVAKLIERSATGFPVIEIDEGDYRVVSKAVTWIASGGQIGPVNVMYLATTSDNTGKIICAISLETQRTLQDGKSLEVTLMLKLK